jgi:hypothetical protein
VRGPPRGVHKIVIVLVLCFARVPTGFLHSLLGDPLGSLGGACGGLLRGLVRWHTRYLVCFFMVATRSHCSNLVAFLGCLAVVFACGVVLSLSGIETQKLSEAVARQ